MTELEDSAGIEVECGANKATLYLERVQMGSKGACVLFDGAWITPNEFQFVSGRETAKDWKRSIKHGGKSLKILLARHLVSFRPPSCICEGCAPGAAPPETSGDRPATTEEPKPADDRPAEPAKKRKRRSEGKHGKRAKAAILEPVETAVEPEIEVKPDEPVVEEPVVEETEKEAVVEEAPVETLPLTEVDTSREERSDEGTNVESAPAEKRESEEAISAEEAVAPKSCNDEAPHLQSPKISQSSPPEGTKTALPHPFASLPAPTPLGWCYYAPYGMMPFTPFASPPSLPFPSIPSSMSSPFSSVSSSDVSSTITEKRDSTEKPLDLSQRKEVMTRPAHPIPLIPSMMTPRSPWMPSFYASHASSSNPHLEAVLTWSSDDVVRFVSTIDHCAKYAKKFHDVGVTGSSLPYLSVEHLMMLIRMEAPDACSLRAAIDRLLFLPSTSLYVPL